MPRVTRASAQARTTAPKPSGRPSSSPRPDPVSSPRTASDEGQGQGSGQSSGQDPVPGEEKPKTVKDYMMKIFKMLIQQVMDDANEEFEKMEKRLKENLQKMKELAREVPR